MSKELITQEALDTALKGGESIAKVVAGTATELMNEAINLFILESVLGVLKFAAVFVVFYIVKKYCDTMAQAAETTNQSKFKAFNAASLVAAIIFFTAGSFPHIQQVGKALIAPKIFLLEKANSLRK